MSNQLALMPKSIDEATALATIISETSLAPPHLKGKINDCYRIVMLAVNANLDPFAVAEKTSEIKGKLMFEGQLVSALCNTSRRLTRNLDYRFNEFQNDAEMVVTVVGFMKGEDHERTINLTYKQACKINNNGQMQKNPEQQMCYIGARIWGRRHMPEVTMGINASDDKYDEPISKTEPVNVTGTEQPTADDDKPKIEERPTPPAKTTGLAGAKNAAAKKTVAKTVEKKAPVKTPAPAKTKVEEKPKTSEPEALPVVEIILNEVATALVVQFTEAARTDLNGIEGMILSLSGQFEGRCYSIEPNDFEGIEAALEHGGDVCVDIFAREHKEKAGVIVPIVQSVYDVPEADAGSEVESAF